MLSDEYRKTLEQMHAGAAWGTKGFHYAGEVLGFFQALQLDHGIDQVRTILDYGCGQGTLAAALEPMVGEALEIRQYDPGIPAHAAAPAPADLVVSTDVLEHIEPEHIDAVIAHIGSLAIAGIFLHIATTPAKRSLPDGRNAHLIVERPAWWMHKLGAIGDRWRVVDHNPGSKTLKVWMVAK